MLTLDASSDVKKGEAVRRQMAQWDQLMHLQIKIHSAIRAFNKLPRDEKARELLASADEETKRNYHAVRRNVIKMTETLFEAEDRLLSGSSQTKAILSGKSEGHDSDDEEIESSEDEKEEDAADGEEETDEEDKDEDMEDDGGSEDDAMDSDGAENGEADDAKKKAFKGRSSRSKLSGLLAKRDKRFETFRNNTLKKWDERTRLTNARSIKDAKKDFSAFDSSVLTQIQKILADRNRLIRRTQTNRSDIERIGGDPEATQDVELFDDHDFYQVLLKELIERKSAQTSDPIEMGRQWLELQKLRERRSKKRVVDTKASKGRKTRFVTIPKLVNFHPAMPESIPWSHEKRNELFKSLFV
ncbi:hypothetical protein L596_008257 [Steinernema carpocapsae]|uniref:Apoptosis-antagonizing transcription factor C-terminal domain-containing protein n=1 Tax=Steinernema carpocapsae TaxID=34508 RepID=A0A4U5PCF6_STECR|nr:hypothetical protein L596_008257 [Steinernema carpocapsae]